MDTRQTIALGQLTSLLITMTGISTQCLTQWYQISVPSFQNVPNYVLLAIGYLLLERKPLAVAWWKYVLICIADVEGNYLVVLAYKYTSISSAMLLDCFTIPVVMVCSKYCLGAKYDRWHMVGVLMCLFGIVMLLLSDVWYGNTVSENEWDYSALYGDFLSLLGSAIYGCSNVAQEYVVKKNHRTEFLGMVGIFGTMIAGMQAYYLEWTIVMEAAWSIGSCSLVVVYVGCLYIMYQGTSFFLAHADAAIFNLSLLTSDFFAVLAGHYLFSKRLSEMYFVGFAFIIFGIACYCRGNRPTRHYQEKVRLLG